MGGKDGPCETREVGMSAGMTCVCPECKQDLLDGEHLLGCSYILTQQQVDSLNVIMNVVTDLGLESLTPPAPREKEG